MPNFTQEAIEPVKRANLNYLAHAYLSGSNDEILAGNFMGDHFKGRTFDLPPQIVKGIRLHRFIDSFTDDHPGVRERVSALKPYSGRYAAIVLDVWMDHLLARNWHAHHSEPLDVYVQQLYRRLDAYQAFFPERGRFMFRYMRRDNWLYHYSKPEGIRRSLSGISRRALLERDLSDGLENLHENDHFHEFFIPFFDDLKKAVDEFMNSSDE